MHGLALELVELRLDLVFEVNYYFLKNVLFNQLIVHFLLDCSETPVASDV